MHVDLVEEHEPRFSDLQTYLRVMSRRTRNSGNNDDDASSTTTEMPTSDDTVIAGSDDSTVSLSDNAQSTLWDQGPVNLTAYPVVMHRAGVHTVEFLSTSQNM